MADKMTDLELRDAILRAQAEQAAARRVANTKGREWSALNELGGSSKKDTNVARAEDRLTTLLEEQKLRIRYGGKAGLDAHRAEKAAEKVAQALKEEKARKDAEKATREHDEWLAMRATQFEAERKLAADIMAGKVECDSAW